MINLDDNNGVFYIASYAAEVLSVSDYYPFGSAMPGRSLNVGEYRFGFQSQEADNEIYGTGNAVSYKYRVEDPRLGRFLSIDPLAAEYPQLSSYAFSGNQVIATTEREGLEPTKNYDPTAGWENRKDPQTYRFYSQASEQSTKGWKYEYVDGEVTRRRSLGNWAGEKFQWYNQETDQYETFVPKGYTSPGETLRSHARPFSYYDPYTPLWNSRLRRDFTGDFITIGFGMDYIGVAGGGHSAELNWVLTGPEASIYPVLTNTHAVGVGVDLDVTFNYGKAVYSGAAEDVSRKMLNTRYSSGLLRGGATFWGTVGIAAGGRISLTGTVTPLGEGYYIQGNYLNIGTGASPTVVTSAVGMSNTIIMHDFNDSTEK